MECSEFEQYAGAFVNGSLEKTIGDAMMAHLGKCPACARLVEAQRLVSEALDSVDSIGAPADFAGRILSSAALVFDEEAAGSFGQERKHRAAIGCTEFERNAAAYADGLSDKSLVRLLDEHSLACSSCARTFAAHRFILSAFETAETVRAPEGFADSVMTAIAAEHDVSPVADEDKITFPYWGELAAAVAVAAMVAVRFFERTGVFAERFPRISGWIGELILVLNRGGISSGGGENSGWFWSTAGEMLTSWAGSFTLLLGKVQSAFFFPVPVPFTDYEEPICLLVAMVIGITYLWQYMNAFGGYPEPTGTSVPR